MIRSTVVAATLSLVLAATACGRAPEPSVAADPTQTSSATIAAEAARASTAATLGAAFGPMVDSTLRVMAVPGAVVRIETPDGSWEQAFGSRTAGSVEPMTVDSHFRIGSITKTMVGTLVLQLVREGLISLDDPVSRFRPDVPNGDLILVSQLLNMRSGLFSYTENWSFNETLDSDPSYNWDPEELLDIAESSDPYFVPGSRFRYTNTNTVLAALIVEDVTGSSIETLLQERIFARLQLSTTSFPAPDDNSIPEPYAHGYLYGTNTSALSSVALPTVQAASARSGTLLPTDVTDLNPSWIWAAGGAISTAADLAAYARHLVESSDLIGGDLQQLRLASVEPRASDPSVIEYGLGFESFGPVIGHDGAIPGYQSFMGHDPDRDITVVVLCNARDGVTGERPANTIAYNIIRALYSTPVPK